MPDARVLRSAGAVLLLFILAFGRVDFASAQVSGPPTANCHVTDGTFTLCSNGKTEWSDVQSVPFPTTNSFLYVNQDAAHTFLYLMYDLPFRTNPLGASDSVHISFDTVEQESGIPHLEEYDIDIFGNGQFQVLEQGQPTPAGLIVGALGFGASPNSTTPHVTAELQVPLVQGPPSVYSPDPLFWSASLPPSPPPDPCPTQPGKTFSDCTKNAASPWGTGLVLSAGGAGLFGGLCSLGTIGGCLPAEAALLVYTFAAGSAGYLIDKYIVGDPPNFVFTIPPDSNFTVIAQPAVYSLSLPTSGLTAQETAALNSSFTNLEQIISFAQAGITSIARAEGATQAGNAFWVTQQTQAAQKFGAQLGALISAFPALQSNLVVAFRVAGVQSTFTSNDVMAFQSCLTTPTLCPSLEVQQAVSQAMQVLPQLGFSSDDISQILQLIGSADPQAVAALGIGTIPQFLSDPSIATTSKQLGTALVQNLPPTNALTTAFTITLPGDYIANGVGLRGQTTGTINVSGIPTGATIARAFLYWGMLDNGVEPSLSQLSLNGTQVTGSLVGSGPDTCWGRSNSFTFRAEVTPLVTGNGAYTLTGVASGGTVLAEGASLVVIYQLTGAPVKTVMLDDGNISIPNGTNAGSASFTGFTATSPVAAMTSFMVGDGQEAQFSIQTPTSFTGSAGTVSFPNLFNSLNGPLWDTSTFDISSVIGVGSSSGSANITNANDCLLWSAQAFSVTTVPVTAPTTATAGVVEANAGGDTVVNLRGLAPNDVPTIQDQIAMIVQFRIIQNPSISATTLTTQLVNGLVSDGVISSAQATTIETAVLQQVVQAVVPFSAFSAKLDIFRGPPPGFDVTSSFTLGNGTNGIKPLTENITLGIGTFSITVPAGSFKKNAKGQFVFQGVINGISLRVQITPLTSTSFAFKADGRGVNLTTLTNPVTVVLTIGDDNGSTNVNADFK